ncbi:unnamed protein product [Microthlaspi erraticum]|uniref:FKB95-like N-terminal Kelch domain-containing protein n=1 Tax=Microthlaspi erraticum TaxID=1685480 RepID=A0A6D2L0C6_9BRAS|nr:unnamed protein product [Microthlaspi erraticum]
MSNCNASESLPLNKRRKKTNEEASPSPTGFLWSLPNEVSLNCLAQVSRADLAALAITSKGHRNIAKSYELCHLRWQMGCFEASTDVCLRIFPEPTPRWFILNPNRRLSPISSNRRQAPHSSSFVAVDGGVYVIGGVRYGEPISDVWFLDCFTHTWQRAPSMNTPRASAAAGLLEGKVHVFGGVADCPNGADNFEVLDPKTQTWTSSLMKPAAGIVENHLVARDIKHSVVTNDGKMLCLVDEAGQSFCMAPSRGVGYGDIDSKPGSRNDWCDIGGDLYCRGTRGRILWCDHLDWKEVKGLEELQDHLCGWGHRWGLPSTKVIYDITRLSVNSSTGNLVIYWSAQLEDDPESLELRSAEISVEKREGGEVWGKIEWSGSVFKLDPLSDSYNVKVLFFCFCLCLKFVFSIVV